MGGARLRSATPEMSTPARRAGSPVWGLRSAPGSGSARLGGLGAGRGGEEAWKLYIRKLQDESNYLLNTPDSTEICCCEDCIVSSENSSEL